MSDKIADDEIGYSIHSFKADCIDESRIKMMHALKYQPFVVAMVKLTLTLV